MYRPIITFQNNEDETKWQNYYVSPSDRVRTREEGIWRRTQTPHNSYESGWKSDLDTRRRVIHYLYNFSKFTVGNYTGIEMSEVYFNYSISLPQQELEYTESKILSSLLEGGWQETKSKDAQKIYRKDDLTLTFNKYAVHPIDIQYPYGFITKEHSLDVTISTDLVQGLDPLLPWKVLKGGMRKKDERGNPKYISDLGELKSYLPFHVEVGCGISLEAGIPALHRLHQLYNVTNLQNGKFIFGGESDDVTSRIIKNPHLEFMKLCEIFSAAFAAKPTATHSALLALENSGAMIGPVMTNNFDGLAHRAGLKELYLRRYDESIPPVDFDNRARSLLVIGSHADRRRVQLRAREKGLKIFYLDPEGYLVDDQFISYPLEGPKDSDFICRQNASIGVVNLQKMLGLS